MSFSAAMTSPLKSFLSRLEQSLVHQKSSDWSSSISRIQLSWVHLQFSPAATGETLVEAVSFFSTDGWLVGW